MATAAKFYEICWQAPPFTASRAEAASAPGCASIDKLSVSFNISSRPALAPPLAGASAMSVVIVIVIVSESQRDLKLISFRFTCAQNKLKPICLLLFILLTSLPPLSSSVFLSSCTSFCLSACPSPFSSACQCCCFIFIFALFMRSFACPAVSSRLVPSRLVSSRHARAPKSMHCAVFYTLKINYVYAMLK